MSTRHPSTPLIPIIKGLLLLNTGLILLGDGVCSLKQLLFTLCDLAVFAQFLQGDIYNGGLCLSESLPVFALEWP